MLGALLKQNTSVTKLDLAGTQCDAKSLAGLTSGIVASRMPLAELHLKELNAVEGLDAAPEALRGLLAAVCRPTLQVVELPRLMPQRRKKVSIVPHFQSPALNLDIHDVCPFVIFSWNPGSIHDIAP